MSERQIRCNRQKSEKRRKNQLSARAVALSTLQNQGGKVLLTLASTLMNIIPLFWIYLDSGGIISICRSIIRKMSLSAVPSAFPSAAIRTSAFSGQVCESLVIVLNQVVVLNNVQGIRLVMENDL